MNTPTDIRKLQARMNELGFGPLQVDGVYGPQTRDAYRRYLDDIDPGTPSLHPAAVQPWWRSRTVLGIVAAGIALIVSRWGWHVNAEDLTPLLLEAAQFGGLVLAFYGTLRRKAPIDKTLVARFGHRDLRLPMRTERSPGGASSSDPRGSFTPE